ncbi:MAG: energy transducer TonB [Calditrichaeota bacterium]|nr:MAG: energy transducer TonB [Calditrichota bacterium]
MKLSQLPEANIKLNYHKRLEFSLIVSLLLTIAFLVGIKDAYKPQEISLPKFKSEDFFKIVPPPVTKFPQKQNLPQKPENNVAISSNFKEVEDDLSYFDDLEIPEPEKFENSILEIPEFAPPEGVIFIHSQIKSKVIGFENLTFFKEVYKAISETLVYPEILRQTGVEGTVHISFDIDKEGVPYNFKVIKDETEGLLSEVALEAVKNLRFTSAFQNGRKVSVKKIIIPIKFKIR